MEVIRFSDIYDHGKLPGFAEWAPQRPQAREEEPIELTELGEPEELSEGAPDWGDDPVGDYYLPNGFIMLGGPGHAYEGEFTDDAEIPDSLDPQFTVTTAPGEGSFRGRSLIRVPYVRMRAVSPTGQSVYVPNDAEQALSIAKRKAGTGGVLRFAEEKWDSGLAATQVKVYGKFGRSVEMTLTHPSLTGKFTNRFLREDSHPNPEVYWDQNAPVSMNDMERQKEILRSLFGHSVAQEIIDQGVNPFGGTFEGNLTTNEVRPWEPPSRHPPNLSVQKNMWTEMAARADQHRAAREAELREAVRRTERRQRRDGKAW